MRLFLTTALGLVLSVAGWCLSQAQADDEVKGPVPSRANSDDPTSEVYRATAVIGMPVTDDAGNEIGHIKDLVINGNTREVLFAVLSMNDGKERGVVYIMPWTIFQPVYGRAQALQTVTLLVPQSVWVQAPTFNVNQWQTTSVTVWAPRVNTYYSKYVTTSGRRGARRAGAPAIRGGARSEDAVDDSKEAAGSESKAAKTPKSPASKDSPAASEEPNQSAPKKPGAKVPASKTPEPKSSDKAPPAGEDDDSPSEASPKEAPKNPESKPQPKAPVTPPAKEPAPSTPKEPKAPKAPKSNDK